MSATAPLDGTVALVTGASSGIGAGRARHIAVNEILVRPTEQQQ